MTPTSFEGNKKNPYIWTSDYKIKVFVRHIKQGENNVFKGSIFLNFFNNLF